eukprot:m.285451 g.285451  ORF g.285451 m.285451 type:complete len:175 (+) comp19434_c3_seq1:2065-2589(+)
MYQAELDLSFTARLPRPTSSDVPLSCFRHITGLSGTRNNIHSNRLEVSPLIKTPFSSTPQLSGFSAQGNPMYRSRDDLQEAGLQAARQFGGSFPTLRELAAGYVHQQAVKCAHLRQALPQSLAQFVLSATHCSFCRRLLFDRFVEVVQFGTLGGFYRVPMLHRFCNDAHWRAFS